MLQKDLHVKEAKFCRQDLITQRIQIRQGLRIVHGKKKTHTDFAKYRKQSGSNCKVTLEPEEVQGFDQIGSQFLAVYDGIEHSVLKQELTSLKT